jgi:hypothetical protein
MFGRTSSNHAPGWRRIPSDFSFYMRSASLRARLRRKERASPYLYPALTSSLGAQAAPRLLDVLGYSLPPLWGWCSLGLTGSAPIFIPVGPIDRK